MSEQPIVLENFRIIDTFKFEGLNEFTLCGPPLPVTLVGEPAIFTHGAFTYFGTIIGVSTQIGGNSYTEVDVDVHNIEEKRAQEA